MKIQYTRIALKSLLDIYDFIAFDNKNAGKVQIDRIQNVIKLLGKEPYLGIVGRVDGTREYFIPKSKYYVVYRVLDTHINILNIIHSARNY